MEEDRMLSDEILLGIINAKSGGGGGGGTDDYDDLKNQPKIENVTLKGNKTAADLGLATATALADKVDKVNGKGLSTNDFTDAYKTAIGDNTTAISGIKNGAEINSFGGVESALALKQNATDNSLDTEAKTIVGAINEHEGDVSQLKSGLTNLDNEVNGDTTYPYADVITIPDAIPANLADCTVKIEPVQDLHGYDKPWVGGAGKNKLPLDLALLKTLNVSGTWVDNVYTLNNVEFTVNLDGGGNVVSIKANGTASAKTIFYLGIFADFLTVDTSYIINSNIYPESDQGAVLQIFKANDAGYVSLTEPYSFTYASEGNAQKLVIRVENTVTANNNVFTPMIRLATETDATFAPYSNECPISGHTEASVQRDGDNLFDEQYTGISETTTYKPIYVGDGTFRMSTTCPKNSSNAANLFFFAGSVNTGASTADNGVWVDNPRTVNSVNGYVTVAYRVISGADPRNYVTKVNSVKTYTIALGDTIYGGTVDFDSGVMTVTDAIKDLSTLSWAYDSTYHRFYADFTGYKKPSSNDVPINAICEQYEVTSSNATAISDSDCRIGANAGSNRLLIGDTRYTDASLFEAMLTENHTELCYEIATPFTVQLTPQQIQLLKGTNTITASTGQISVTVNGVSGAIGAVQEQVNGLAEDVAEIKPLNYSTTEQKTGQKWIDGKDIYFCTFTGLTITTTGNWQDTGIDSSNMDTIIGGLAIDDSKQSIVCSFGFGTNPTVILRAYMSTNVIKSVTLFYTKTA